MSEKVASGAALGVEYSVESLTGRVAGEKSWSKTETNVTTTGGGGTMIGGTGSVAPTQTKVETKTTTYQDVFVADDDGREHKVHLKNDAISCREGHRLTLLKILTKSGESYFRSYNHDTRESHEIAGAVSKRMFPLYIHIATVVVWALIVWLWSGGQDFDGFERFASTIIGTGLGFLVLYGIAKIVGGIRGMKVSGNPDVKAFWAKVKQ